MVDKGWDDGCESMGKIEYGMLGEGRGRLRGGLGVMMEEEGMGYGGRLVVNGEGKMKIAEIEEKKMGGNGEEVVGKVEGGELVGSEEGEVCGGKWKKGGGRLKGRMDLVGKI